jgi:hypothetical protein
VPKKRHLGKFTAIWIRTERKSMPIVQNLPTVRRKALSLFGAVSVLALMLPATSSTAAAQTESPEQANTGLAPRLEGAWVLTIERVTQGVTFTAVQSFTAGGVTLAMGSIDRTPPPPISLLQGSWKRKGRNRFDSTTYFFAFDLAGNAVAMIKNNVVFHLNGRDELTGFGRAFSCDLQAENCTPAPLGPIRVKGKRIVPESVEEEPADNPASE